jgi:hypothetical protein
MDPGTWNRARGYTLRRDEKGAEVIDGQRVAEVPLCRYGCKLQKRKGLRVTMEIKELVTREESGIGECHFEAPLEARGKQCELFGTQWQTRGTIAWNYSDVQVIISISFERGSKILKCPGLGRPGCKVRICRLQVQRFRRVKNRTLKTEGCGTQFTSLCHLTVSGVSCSRYGTNRRAKRTAAIGRTLQEP